MTVTDGAFHEWFIPTLAGRLKISSYLEIGLWHGDTIMGVKRARPHARCIGVDRVPLDLAAYGITVFTMDSEKFWSGGFVDALCFDMVFIDADHSAGAVQKDFARAWEHTSREGLIILHDTNPATLKETDPGFSGDCWMVARDLHAKGFEGVTLPFSPGLTIIRKRERWGPP